MSNDDTRPSLTAEAIDRMVVEMVAMRERLADLESRAGFAEDRLIALEGT